MKNFYQLKVSKINQLTPDSVEITFSISEEIKDVFRFKAGQYVTIKHAINGEDIRRSYSLCSNPNSTNISIGVKRIENGKMSTFLTRELEVGNYLSVMPPLGSFVLNGDRVVGICAGSGITPILSMMKTEVSDFVLIYGNKKRDSAMFLDDINRMNVKSFFSYSRENVPNCFHGRVDNDVLKEIHRSINFLEFDYFYLCGPNEMISNVEEYLLSINVPKNKILFEKFTSDDIIQDSEELSIDEAITSDVTVIIDGDEFEYQLSSDAETILDSAMEEGADLPFSCKGAVCCVCKAKVIEGKVKMKQNFSLSEEEVNEGYILTCQSHPITEKVVVDYDEI